MGGSHISELFLLVIHVLIAYWREIVTELQVATRGLCPGSHRKLKQTGWLKTTKLFSQIWAGNPKSRCLVGLASLEGLHKNLLHASMLSFWWSSTILGMSLPLFSCGVLGCMSPSMSVSGFLSYKETSHWISACLNLVWLHFNLNLQRPFFQVKSHSQVLGIRIWTYLFWRGSTQLTTGTVKHSWTMRLERKRCGNRW